MKFKSELAKDAYDAIIKSGTDVMERLDREGFDPSVAETVQLTYELTARAIEVAAEIEIEERNKPPLELSCRALGIKHDWRVMEPPDGFDYWKCADCDLERSESPF